MPNLALETVSDDSLVRQFRQFYEELERIWQTAPPCSNSAEAIVLARQVSRQLENLIEMQSLEYRQGGSRFAQQAAEDARYIKAALADEVLLRQDWPGREIWSQHLLEASMFRSSVAGEKVFDDIKHLLRAREPAQRTLAQLYLFTLALGFQGQYRDQNAKDLLAGLRRELFQFVFQRQADLAGRDRVLSPQPYANTLSHIAPKRMAPLSRWKLILLGSLIGLLAISELLWLWPTWQLRQVLNGTPTYSQDAKL
ncbi:MAG: DotU family type IV/VI secretion system protein [Akkermansiaceae bacterium]|jgi:type VI secretion system protein ImpK|nr:DotU family type IV/VI secretion system protein [Akkermansiaceae bacterium]